MGQIESTNVHTSDAVALHFALGLGPQKRAAISSQSQPPWESPAENDMLGTVWLDDQVHAKLDNGKVIGFSTK